mgnify:FL=1|tara:strand:- start:422 stop:1402 length:981 start_codon:yes stop_codon:yes gene_type:complete
MKKIAGINGFGRFGLHLLKYWLDRASSSNFNIGYINDDTITIDQALDTLNNDNKVFFTKYRIKKLGNHIRILESNGSFYEIEFTNSQKDKIHWIGEPDYFFECSGKNTMKKDCLPFIKEKTKLAIISATSWDADGTYVYGFNHQDLANEDKIISYGSCTVNAYVPFANFIDQTYSIIDSDVSVIHNIQEYKLKQQNTLTRKFCTLEKSGPSLLDCIHKNNFVVNYTVIPYSGISLIDFRFRVNKEINYDKFILDLNHAIYEGSLKNLYDIDEVDNGPEIYNCSTHSSVFIKKNIRILNNQIYLQGYFDNENSVNRYYDLCNYIAAR